MKNTLKKIGLSTALAAILLTSSLNAGGAVSGGASEWTQIGQMVADGVDRANQYTKQLQEYATQVNQYQQQIMQYRNQFDSYRNMLQNIGQLPQQQWDQFSQSVIGLKKSLEFGEALSYASSSYDTDFKKIFPGFDKYLRDAKSGDLDFQTTYKQLRTSTRDTVNGALKSLGLQANDMQNDEATMRQLQNLSQSATGQLGAIQAANAIAMHQTHTFKKLQQTIMSQANMQGEFMLAENEKDAFQAAQSKAKADGGIEPTVGDETQTGKW